MQLAKNAPAYSTITHRFTYKFVERSHVTPHNYGKQVLTTSVFNSLWPIDAIWLHTFKSTLFLVSSNGLLPDGNKTNTWANVDLSPMKLCDIFEAISKEVHMSLIRNIYSLSSTFQIAPTSLTDLWVNFSCHTCSDSHTRFMSRSSLICIVDWCLVCIKLLSVWDKKW